MINFEYHIPTKIYFGPDEFLHLGKEVASYGKRVLLTYGGGSIKKTGLYKKVLEQLAQFDLQVTELSGIDPNPRIESVREGGKLCKEYNIDVVLAVGGGSVIDCSKFICAAACSDIDPWEWFTPARPKVTKALPLLTVLTLAATGSEMDTGAVITNLAANEKIGRAFPQLLPKVSFLDPTNTFTVSPFQTAAGSADIISHTLEAYFSQDKDLFFLDTFMEGLLRTVIKFAPRAMNKGDDYEARANLMWASTWAINGFVNGGKTQAWSVHPIEHEVSAYYDITHGLGLAILTPHWMRHVLAKDQEHTLPKFVQFAEQVFGITSQELSDLDKALAGIDALQTFFVNDLQLAPSLSKLAIDTTHFDAMAKHAAGQAGIIHGFIDLYPEDIREIYQASL